MLLKLVNYRQSCHHKSSSAAHPQAYNSLEQAENALPCADKPCSHSIQQQLLQTGLCVAVRAWQQGCSRYLRRLRAAATTTLAATPAGGPLAAGRLQARR
jgi:hypothetical protein